MTSSARRRVGPGPATGGRSARTPRRCGEPGLGRPAGSPVQRAGRGPRPCTETCAAPAPSSRGRRRQPSASYRPGRCRRSRSLSGTVSTQLRSVARSCSGHPARSPTSPLGCHERPPCGDGTPSPTSASGGRSYARHRHAERLSMPPCVLAAGARVAFWGMATKSERKAAREAVASYHEACLAELVHHVGEAVDRFRAGEVDAFEFDDVMFQYSRAAKELWKFCNTSDMLFTATLLRDQPKIDWWERGARKRR